jgi:hypothetical protein
MNKAKSFLVFILLFGLLLGLPLSATSAASHYLNLTSSPPGAIVYVNNVRQARLTPCIFNNVITGAHYTITFRKSGYIPQTVQITAPKTNSSRVVVLKKVLVLLNITSSPPGATVYINNVRQASLTPYTFKTAVPGTLYTVAFSKVGYVAQTTKITPTTTASAVAVILKKVLVFNITSSPTGATVYINKVKQPKLTPYAFKTAVPGTSYTVTFSKVGYVAQTVQITAPSSNYNLSVVLKKALVLYVTSSPSGATVYVNNVKQASSTPCTITGYAYGTVLNLLLNKTGYLPYSKAFSIWTTSPSHISTKLLKMPTPSMPAPTIIKAYDGVVPAVQYASTTATESKTFAWTYNGTAYTWNVQAPSSLLLSSRAWPLYLTSYFASPTVAEQQALLGTLAPLQQTMLQECWQTSYGDYVAYTLEPSNTAYIKQLALNLNLAAKASGYDYDYFHMAEFILNFVQTAIPYRITSSYQQLPAQTLFDGGQCVDKSILYASLLKALGYKVALFGFPYASGSTYTGHETVGVAFATTQMTQTVGYQISYYSQNGRNYYFAEPSCAGYWLGLPSTPQIPLIYPLN